MDYRTGGNINGSTRDSLILVNHLILLRAKNSMETCDETYRGTAGDTTRYSWIWLRRSAFQESALLNLPIMNFCKARQMAHSTASCQEAEEDVPHYVHARGDIKRGKVLLHNVFEGLLGGLWNSRTGALTAIPRRSWRGPKTGYNLSSE